MNDSERPRQRARWWGVLAMVAIAAVAAVLSYFDGLFVARLAGNHDWRAWLYPLLPDELIVICLIALLAAKRRPAWATSGLVLGIGLTLAMNVGAGMAHSLLDAVVDGFVPVVFFVAVEVFIGYVRRGRAEDVSATRSGHLRRSTPSTVLESARTSMAETAAAGNPLTRNQLQTRWRLSRAEADDIWQPYKPPAGAERPPAPVPAGVHDVPAGDGLPPAPAGAALNGSGPRGGAARQGG